MQNGLKSSALQKILAIISFTFAMIYGTFSLAIDIKLHENVKLVNSIPILVFGRINHGDTRKLAKFLQNIGDHNFVVYLSSEGGNLYEGMRLGYFFNRMRIKTVVEGGSDCFSACAIAFLGGTDAAGRPWRSSSTNSKLGFHSFRIRQPDNVNTDDIQSIVADLIEYSHIVKAPIEIIINNFRTPNRDIWTPSHDEICRLGIKLWDNDKNVFKC